MLRRTLGLDVLSWVFAIENLCEICDGVTGSRKIEIEPRTYNEDWKDGKKSAPT
jgi:hypothetical protein